MFITIKVETEAAKDKLLLKFKEMQSENIGDGIGEVQVVLHDDQNEVDFNMMRRVLGLPLHPMSLNDHARMCRKQADRWYHDPQTGDRIFHNPGERFMLITSEISEAFEAMRKNKMDDHLPRRKSVEVELCDALIRIFDFSGEHGFDLDGAYYEKIAFNEGREDHTNEARNLENGKKW